MMKKIMETMNDKTLMTICLSIVILGFAYFGMGEIKNFAHKMFDVNTSLVDQILEDSPIQEEK